MRKYLSLFLTLLIVSASVPTFAMSVEESEAAGLRDMRAQAENTDAPKWNEYVPAKYQNPRTDFSKGKSIAELSAGIVLTDLLITAPIGIPMICHSTTKLKNVGWAQRKAKFFEGLEEAEKITDDNERQLYYDKLLQNCKMTEKKHQAQLQRNANKENNAKVKEVKELEKEQKK